MRRILPFLLILALAVSLPAALARPAPATAFTLSCTDSGSVATLDCKGP